MNRLLTAIENQRRFEPALVEGVKVSERERHVILLVGEGFTNKQIAHRLGLVEGTVKLHLHNIYRKLNVPNRTTLMACINRLLLEKSNAVSGNNGAIMPNGEKL